MQWDKKQLAAGRRALAENYLVELTIEQYREELEKTYRRIHKHILKQGYTLTVEQIRNEVSRMHEAGWFDKKK